MRFEFTRLNPDEVLVEATRDGKTVTGTKVLSGAEVDEEIRRLDHTVDLLEEVADAYRARRDELARVWEPDWDDNWMVGE